MSRLSDKTESWTSFNSTEVPLSQAFNCISSSTVHQLQWEAVVVLGRSLVGWIWLCECDAGRRWKKKKKKNFYAPIQRKVKNRHHCRGNQASHTSLKLIYLSYINKLKSTLCWWEIIYPYSSVLLVSHFAIMISSKFKINASKMSESQFFRNQTPERMTLTISFSFKWLSGVPFAFCFPSAQQAQ